MGKFTKFSCIIYCIIAAFGILAPKDSDRIVWALIISVMFCIFGLSAVITGFVLSKMQRSRAKRCTQYTEGTLLSSRVGGKQDDGEDSFAISYLVGDQLVKSGVTSSYTDCMTVRTPIGSTVPVWYNPDDVRECIVSENGDLLEQIASSIKLEKWGAITFVMNLIIVPLIFFI